MTTIFHTPTEKTKIFWGLHGILISIYLFGSGRDPSYHPPCWHEKYVLNTLVESFLDTKMRDGPIRHTMNKVSWFENSYVHVESLFSLHDYSCVLFSILVRVCIRANSSTRKCHRNGISWREGRNVNGHRENKKPRRSIFLFSNYAVVQTKLGWGKKNHSFYE